MKTWVGLTMILNALPSCRLISVTTICDVGSRVVCQFTVRGNVSPAVKGEQYNTLQHLAHDEDIAPSLPHPPTRLLLYHSAFAAAETSSGLGPSGFEKFPGPARPLLACLLAGSETERASYSGFQTVFLGFAMSYL